MVNMKGISAVFMAFILVSTGQANAGAQKCEEQKGSWELNENTNQWQCYDVKRGIVDINLTASPKMETSETNITKTETSLGVKVLAVVAAPVLAVGYVVTAIVVAPFWLAKKIFGN